MKFHCYNAFLSSTAESSTGFGSRIDVSKDQSERFLFKVFTEYGLMRMLETFGYSSIDQVSPLFGVVLDILCKKSSEAEVAILFTH